MTQDATGFNSHTLLGLSFARQRAGSGPETTSSPRRRLLGSDLPESRFWPVSVLPTTHELAWFAVSAVGEREFQPYNETLLSVCISADGRNP